MKLLACLTSLLAACLLGTTKANNEKVVFVASPAIAIPAFRPGLQHLNLKILTPQRNSLKTSLPVAFPSDKQPGRLHSWYLLQGLEEGQRYEVRICWAATQPTAFWLETYNITHVFDTPDLIQRLAAYADERQDIAAIVETTAAIQQRGTTLFLQVSAAADFYSNNHSLMQHPPPVDVDIILDPYLLNIIPQSLGPTTIYLVILAFVAWYISGFVWHQLQGIGSPKKHTD